MLFFKMFQLDGFFLLGEKRRGNQILFGKIKVQGSACTHKYQGMINRKTFQKLKLVYGNKKLIAWVLRQGTIFVCFLHQIIGVMRYRIFRNFIVRQVTFNKYLLPNEHSLSILWYLFGFFWGVGVGGIFKVLVKSN